ncbi:thermonuclease family protein [Patescibacteria group bacterium AH-259-L07]|nr:thermonuclease family protein [Patescibacteria group bacterium AH-259-L07]
MKQKQREKSVHPVKSREAGAAKPQFNRVKKMNEQWMKKRQMKKRRLRIIKQYLLAGIIAVGGILATLVATETGGKSTRKTLSIILITLIVLLASLFAVDLVEEPADTTSNLIEVEQESVRMMRDLLSSRDDERYFVNYAIDGDTIKVEVNDDTRRVRLIGIDAPEKGECYYEEARTALASLVEGERVRLETGSSDVDVYGRWLRYVYVSGDIFVNRYLLRNGYAQTDLDPHNKQYDQDFISAREEAIRQDRGLWSACDDSIETYKQENPGLREIHEPPPSLDCIIKGNISKREYGKTYLTPECGNYDRTKIDTNRGEQYFCTEEEAIAAGFRKAGDCP